MIRKFEKNDIKAIMQIWRNENIICTRSFTKLGNICI